MILKYFEYFSSVLSTLEDLGTLHASQIREEVGRRTGATPEERMLRTKSEGGDFIFSSRVHWATYNLFKAGALTRSAPATFEITEKGRHLLRDFPAGVTLQALQELNEAGDGERDQLDSPEFVLDAQVNTDGGTPQEKIESSIQELDVAIARELVVRLREMPPDFLEKTVLVLLNRMGYGDGEDSLRHLGGIGDEGVDGVINQDRLGLQRVYVQAKRYGETNKVGRPALQEFQGALHGQAASGGIMITTSSFTPDARDYVSKLANRNIVLIDGIDLGKLLVQFHVGISVRRNYEVPEIDENFFNQE